MDRVVAQLLAEIDGAQGTGGNGDLFIIGTFLFSPPSAHCSFSNERTFV